MSVRLVYCTCPDSGTADTLACLLVEEKLAACVNIIPGVSSIYRWDGKVQSDQEVLMLIKTTSEQFTTLRDRLEQAHPYELPEIIAVSVEQGLPAYLQWVVTEIEEPLINS